MAKKRKKRKEGERRTFGRLWQDPATGKFRARVPLGRRTESGRPAYRAYTFDTEDQAETFLEDAYIAKRAGVLNLDEPEKPEEAELTVPEAIDAYIESRAALGRSERTISSYKCDRKRIGGTGSPLARVIVSEVRPELIEQYIEYRRERTYVSFKKDGERVTKRRNGTGASDGTVKGDLALLSGTLTWLHKKGKIDRNPMKAIDRPKDDPRETVPLDEEEVKRLLAAVADDDRLRPIVLFGLYTGCRRGEMEGLRWGDVSLKEDANGNAEGMVVIRRRKVRNTARITMRPELAEEMKHLRASRRKIPKDTEYVFSNERGTFRIRRRWERALKDAGLAGKRIGLHNLRHTAAVRLHECGATVVEVMQALGHSNIGTTQRYLAHVKTSRVNEAFARLSYEKRVLERPRSAHAS
ncbi:MAG: tyrosine-type recombinase/integrase [Planctomycetota bacterium]|jgi:integrase